VSREVRATREGGPFPRLPSGGVDHHDARPDEQADQLAWLPWRVGRRVPRNIYAQLGPDPDDGDVAIGQLDSSILAADAVASHNEALRRRR